MNYKPISAKPISADIKKELIANLKEHSEECDFYIGVQPNARVRCLIASGRPSATFCLYNCEERKHNHAKNKRNQ